MKYYPLVNTKQGSDSCHRFSNGNTLPLVQRPFGMAAFCPQTNEGNRRWYYHPKSRSFEGVRITHQPSPWIADYGAMVFMPQKLPLNINEERRYSGFRPADAVLQPAYLKYNLLRTRSTVEVTPTARCGKVRVTFTDNENNFFSVLPVEGNCGYTFDTATNTLYAYTTQCDGGVSENFREFVVFRFEEGAVLADEIYVQTEDSLTKALQGEGEQIGIHIGLAKKAAEIAVATSYISFEQAKISLNREIGTRCFDEIRAEGEALWESYLSRVEIEATDEKQLKTFYSCMYRAFLYPHRCSEVDSEGNEIHYSPYDGKVHGGVRFTDNGFWDTYRTVYPFFALVAKDEIKEMLVSFINDYKESGWLPRWLSIGERGCMPSTLVDAVICDGAVKGLIEKEWLEVALEGMLKHATTDAPYDYYGRNGAESYCELGYVPYDEQNESVNLTADAAYGDWCIAVIAEILGKADIAAEYRLRAKNYKNLFDKETGFMRPKNRRGEFRPDFTPIGWGRDYTEGSAWQNSFAVPHDMAGLAELYGGKEQLMQKIDALFAAKPDYEIMGYDCEIHEITEMASVDFGQCAISNQPSFHIPYIYAELGCREKTAYWVEKLCNEAFSFEDDGFPGDEDNGTTAIWYIFGVLGFYPFCPGRTDYLKSKKLCKTAFILGKEIDVDADPADRIEYKDIIG